MLDQVVDDLLHVVDGEGEAQALGGDAGAGLRILGGDDAHHIAVAVKEGAAGVARVDVAVGLQHVQGGGLFLAGGLVGAAGGDQPVQGGHQAVSEGVGQLAQGVADGVHRLAHHQLVAVAQGDGLQAGGVDLQHRHVIVLLAAHQSGGVLGAVGEGHLNGHGRVVHRILNDVIVGDNVPVLGEHKAGAAGRRGGGLSEDVHGGIHRDAHAGGQVGRIQLLRGHGLAAVAVGHRVHIHRGPLALIDHRVRLGDLLIGRRAACAGGPAHHHAGQQQGDGPLGEPAGTLPGRLGSGTDRARDGSRRGVGVVAEAAAVSVVLTIIKIEFIVCHDQSLLRVKLWGFPV